MRVNPELLKARIRSRLLNRSMYPAKGLTLSVVLARAADLAAQIIDEMAAREQAAEGRRAAASREVNPGPRQIPPRLAAANAKRRRLQEALANGPLSGRELRRRAQLTPGEFTYLVRSTPGVSRVGDRYALALDGAPEAQQSGR